MPACYRKQAEKAKNYGAGAKSQLILSAYLKFGENNLTKMSLLRHSRLKRRRRVVHRHDLSASDTTCLSGVALAKTDRFPA